MCEGSAGCVCLIGFLYMFAGRAVCDPEAPPWRSCPSQEGLPPLCGPQRGYRQENGLPRNHPPRWIRGFDVGHCSAHGLGHVHCNCLRKCERCINSPPDHLLSFLQETWGMIFTWPCCRESSTAGKRRPRKMLRSYWACMMMKAIPWR